MLRVLAVKQAMVLLMLAVDVMLEIRFCDPSMLQLVLHLLVAARLSVLVLVALVGCGAAVVLSPLGPENGRGRRATPEASAPHLTADLSGGPFQRQNRRGRRGWQGRRWDASLFISIGSCRAFGALFVLVPDGSRVIGQLQWEQSSRRDRLGLIVPPLAMSARRRMQVVQVERVGGVAAATVVAHDVVSARDRLGCLLDDALVPEAIAAAAGRNGDAGGGHRRRRPQVDPDDAEAHRLVGGRAICEAGTQMVQDGCGGN